MVKARIPKATVAKSKPGFTCIGCNKAFLTLTKLRMHIANNH